MASPSPPSTPLKTILALDGLPERATTAVELAAGLMMTPSSVNPNQPPWPAYRGYHEFSFATSTMQERLPTILAKAIEDVVRTLNEQHDREKIEDLIQCIKRMEVLMLDLQTNKQLRPILDDGEGDVALWNKEIANYFSNRDFLSATWVFAEAYKYRRLHECFSISKHWKNYDVFFRQKCDTFARSSDAVFELSTRFARPWRPSKENLSPSEDLAARHAIFRELTQVCLWGNSTDLSLLINMTEEDIKKLQSTGGDALAATEANILGNHLQGLWDAVKDLKGGRIDFILDNAGFELYCDMLYADYLVQSGLASTIHFHGKRFAWFVSDVTRADFDWLINACVYGKLFPNASESERASLRALGLRWMAYEESGTWVYEAHPFWCTGYTFWELPSQAPDLFVHLAGSDLVVFKGDLNHRKLTYDCAAPADTPFEKAIGPLASMQGAPRVASLRTIKSDVVVGLEDKRIATELDEKEKGWRISGKYAVILLSQGRPGEEISF